MKGYPKWFYLMLCSVLVALFATGTLLAPTILDLKLEWDMPWRLASDQRIGVAALHTLLSFLTLTLIGALWSVHMRSGWKRRSNHHSGLGLIVVMLLLLITGIGIFYLGDEDNAMIASLGHMAIGGMLPVIFSYHALAGYQKARRRIASNVRGLELENPTPHMASES